MPYYLTDMVPDPSGLPESGPDGSGRLPRVAVLLGLSRCDAVSCRDLNWCVVWVPNTLAATANIIPLLSSVTVGSLTASQRNAITAFFDSHNIPRSWITASMTLSTVGRWLARYISAFYRLTNNGELSIRTGLTQTFSQLSETRRQAVKDWFGRYGVTLSDLRDTDTLETIIATIVTQYRLQIRFGGEVL